MEDNLSLSNIALEREEALKDKGIEGETKEDRIKSFNKQLAQRMKQQWKLNSDIARVKEDILYARSNPDPIDSEILSQKDLPVMLPKQK